MFPANYSTVEGDDQTGMFTMTSGYLQLSILKISAHSLTLFACDQTPRKKCTTDRLQVKKWATQILYEIILRTDHKHVATPT